MYRAVLKGLRVTAVIQNTRTFCASILNQNGPYIAVGTERYQV